MICEFEIKNQTLKRIDTNSIVNESQEYLQLDFDFKTEDWNGYTRYVFFRLDNKNYPYPLSEDSIIVPNVFLKGEKVSFGVYGVNGESRITTNLIILRIGKSFFDGKTYDIPDEYTKTILDLFQDLIDDEIDAKADKTYVDDELDLKVDKETGKGLFSGSYNDLSDKPFIPGDVSDLTDNLNTPFTPKQHTHTESQITDLGDYVEKSATTGLLKNDGSVDTTDYSVSLVKQQEAEQGYAHTYVLYQGDTALSPKINIPKDFLVKSATVETCEEDDVPVEGYVVGDKYLDFVVNSVDGTGPEEHIYLKVTELVDVYSADNSSLVLSSGNVFSIKDGGVTYAKISQSTIGTGSNQIAAGDHSHSTYIEKSNTVGLVKNDGTIDTTSYSTFSGNYSDLSGKPSLATVATTGDYDDLVDKPSIPVDVSDLSDTTGVIPTDLSDLSDSSHIIPDVSGKLDIAQTSYKGKNVVVDGTTGNITFENKPTIPSDVADLTDTHNTQFTPKSHTHSEYVNPEIVDNLNSNDATKVLSAKQGKALGDLIGNAISYINQ